MNANQGGCHQSGGAALMFFGDISYSPPPFFGEASRGNKYSSFSKKINILLVSVYYFR